MLGVRVRVWVRVLVRVRYRFRVRVSVTNGIRSTPELDVLAPFCI